MASLLGGDYCIYSLRRDVKDLQAILDEVHSRVGLVKYQSWKFPDKASCDLDIQQLLDRCQYSEDDEEDCQMSHVMLYDIVIDRLVYLLQSFACFNEVLLNVEKGGIQASPSPNKGGAVKSMSIGLTVKKCWGRMTQIAGLLQKLAKEVNTRSEHASSVAKEEGSSKQMHKSVDSCQPEQLLVKQSPVPAAACNEKDVSCDNRSTGCQTVETAYTNCESCLRTQSCLHDVGRTVVDLCKAQNLPTALEDYLLRCNEKVPMSVAEIVRWGKHKTKDLSRVSRHMTSLVNQVVPLKADLATALKDMNQANSQLQMRQSVYDRKEEELRDEFRRREFKLREIEKDLKKKITTLESVKASMQEEVDKCQWKISDLKDELLQKHRDQLSIENTMSQLKEEAVEGRQYKQDALKFKNELTRVNAELESVKQSFHRDRKLYENEQTKNENMEHHEKMLKEKQRMLIARMDTINEECEKLRDDILVVEEERDAAFLKLKVLEKNQSDEEKSSQKDRALLDIHKSEVDSLRESINFLRGENEELKSLVSAYTERERLIVAYPDLNQSNVASPMVQGSGDVIVDMRNQIEANGVRIQILEKENSALLKTLQKVNSSPDDFPKKESELSSGGSTPITISQSHALQEKFHDKFSQPIQLWKMPKSEDSGENFDEDQTQDDIYGLYKDSQPLRDKAPPSQESSRSKPRKATHGAPNKPHRRQDAPGVNGIRFGSDTSSSLEAYKRIKQQQPLGRSQTNFPERQSFVVGSGRRAKSGRPLSAKSALFKPWT